jgi:hypothetical protein
MAKSEVMRLRLTSEEKQAFEAASDLAGIALSAWCRERLRRAARIELEDAGQQIPFIRVRKEEK